MLGFIGRRREIDVLAGELDQVLQAGSGRFVWIRGRRRIGKSRLVEEFVAQRRLPHVFFQAPRRPSADALERFRLALQASTLPSAADVTSGARFTTWPAALRVAASGATQEHPVAIVIDELPYLVEHDAGFPGDLQDAWDHVLQRLPVLLICIGSDVRMMKALTDHPAELHDRPTRELHVAPISPRELAGLGDVTAEEAFDRYLIVGGFPILAKSWPAAQSRRRFLERCLADAENAFVINGLRILDAEFESGLRARDILEAIGHGERTFGAIRSATGNVNQATLTHALDVLTVKKQLVDARLPFAAPPGRRDRRYAVVDPYLRFWLRFVAPNIEEIDRGRGDLVVDRIERDWPSYRGKAIEPLVQRSVERLLPDPARFGAARYVGSYWTRSNDPEVDLVGAPAPVPATVSFVGSIKWREHSAFGRRDTHDLISKRSQVPGASQALLIGVSRSGFHSAGLDVALGPEELLAAWPAP